MSQASFAAIASAAFSTLSCSSPSASTSIEPSRQRREVIELDADEARRIGTPGLHLLDQPVAQHRRAAIDHRVDQRDADGAAEVAHQVEQAAGVGHPRVRQHAPSASRVGGSRQNMIATPRTTCGQNISSKSRLRASGSR